jgi:hypothetical protein
MELHLLYGPPAKICVDPAPGFMMLRNDEILSKFCVVLEIARVKNKNHIAEEDLTELQEEVLRHEPGTGPVTDFTLSVAVAWQNSRI